MKGSKLLVLILGLTSLLSSPIEDFLIKNGFSDVLQEFLAQDVVIEVVHTLSDGDLRDLGLTTIGERRLFNLAAATLLEEGGREEQSVREEQAGREEEGRGEEEGGRREGGREVEEGGGGQSEGGGVVGAEGGGEGGAEGVAEGGAEAGGEEGAEEGGEIFFYKTVARRSFIISWTSSIAMIESG